MGTEAWREEARLVREGKRQPGPQAPELAVPVMLGEGDKALSVTHIIRGPGGASAFIVGSPRRPKLVTSSWESVHAHLKQRGIEAGAEPPPAATAGRVQGELVFGVAGLHRKSRSGTIKGADFYFVGDPESPRAVSYSWEAIRQCMWGWVAKTAGGITAARHLHAYRFARRPPIFYLGGAAHRIKSWALTGGWTVVLFIAERIGPTIEALSEEPPVLARVVLDRSDRVLSHQPLDEGQPTHRPAPNPVPTPETHSEPRIDAREQTVPGTDHHSPETELTAQLSMF